jgi:hypothetical protein
VALVPPAARPPLPSMIVRGEVVERQEVAGQ